MFNIADRNKDGKLDFEEVCTILKRSRPNMSTAEIELLFEQVDKNKDGAIAFSELADFIHEGSLGPSKRSTQKLKDAFLTLPTLKPGTASHIVKGNTLRPPGTGSVSRASSRASTASKNSAF
jgi:calcium-binding protein CML